MTGRLVVIVFLIAITIPLPVRGQTGRATITGSVIDSSGRVVPGVEVVAGNLETGVSTRVLSSGVGIYSILDLPAGRYSVRFDKEGFKRVQLSSVSLHVDQVAQVNARLVVGLKTNVVNVSETIPLLDKETSVIGTNMKGSVVSELPLNIYGGRAIESFAVAITPGYSLLSSPYNAVINGTQTFTKDFTVDGLPPPRRFKGIPSRSDPVWRRWRRCRRRPAA